MKNDKEKLKQRVLDFVKMQKGYNAKNYEELEAFCEDEDTYGVVYGEDLQAGIAGFGDTAELAYDDFVRSWNQFNGFEWIKDYKYTIKLQLNGIYIKSDVVFYQLKIKNNSNINYDIDMLRLFINDKKKSKRTASQEIEIQPLYVYGDTSTIKGKSKNIFVFALQKFTIPDQKYLSIQLMEKNGGRHLQLKVHNRTIVKAKPPTQNP